jgi:eukaryotic-like serine/threonine-protein kinase
VNITIPDFWRLLGDSRLLTQAQLQRLSNDFAQVKHKSPPTARTLAQWLMDHRAITKYQATVLLAGRPGPFFYGEYKVYERVDKGSLSGRFRAVHNPTKHPVLLRFLSGPVLTDARLWAAASANTAAAAAIVSPYVQRHFEAVDLQKFKFLVSEDVRGTGLDEKITEGRVRPAEACRIMRLVALGLAEMHSHGRICGDVRLATIVVEAAPNEPNVKLLYEAHQPPAAIDFALASASDALATKADYLAPELLTPGRSPDALADIYALGCTLYALLSGTLPFAGSGVEQKLARHLSEPIKPLEAFGIPQPLAQLVTYLMAKNPSVRYQSGAIVAEQLGMFVEPAAIRVKPPAEPPTLAVYEQAVAQKVQGSGFAVQQEVRGRRSEIGNLPPSQPIAVADQPRVAVPPPVVGVSVSPPSRATTAAEIMRRKKAQQKRNMLVVAALAGLVLIVGGAGAAIWWTKQHPPAVASSPTGNVTPPELQATTAGSAMKVEQPSISGDGSSASTEESVTRTAASKTAVAAIGVSQQVVPDDGKMLWASPTAGKPLTLRCVPPEGQLFLIVRPTAMLASDEGRRTIAALGPGLDSERKKFEAASGFKLEEIEQLTITLHNNDGKFPRTSFVVKIKEPASAEQLLTKWGNPAAAKEGGATYYTGPTWAYYIPQSSEDERTFAMGEARDLKDVAAAAGAPPAVFREIERLRRMTDDQRHFSLLFYPQFLFNDDGAPLFAAERAKIRQPLAWLLGDHVQAASASGYFGDEFYFELRMRASLDKEPHALAMELKDRLDKIPGLLEDYFVTLSPPPYWKKLAFRYPAMIRELHNQMRTGVDNETAMVNSVLPAAAGHNLVLGGELLVSTTPGQAVTSAGPATAATSSGPKTIADALQIKTSYSFAQQSLEFAMIELQDDVKSNLKGAPFEFAIKIIGDDLKLDGITRNQSIRDFKQENQTVADILTALVRKANPVTTVKDPSETDQKLVWLIGPDPDNPARQAVLITTRNAAKAKNYTLPPIFVAKGKS